MKIDVTKINGYEEMTPEEKIAALEDFDVEIPKDDSETRKLKEALNNASAEAADYKRKFKERQSEEERAKAEQEEFIKALQEQNAQLTREKTAATLEKGFGAAGDYAKGMAEAFLDNNAEDFVAHFNQFIEAHDKELGAEALRKTPRPDNGQTGKDTITKEQFDKMGYKELSKLMEENPELYAELKGE